MSNTKKDNTQNSVDEIKIDDTEQVKQNQIIADLQAQIESMQKTITQLQSKQNLDESDFKKANKPKLTVTTFLEKGQKPKVATA